MKVYYTITSTDVDCSIEFDPGDDTKALAKGLLLLRDSPKLFHNALNEITDKYGRDTANGLMVIIADLLNNIPKEGVLDLISKEIPMVSPIKI